MNTTESRREFEELFAIPNCYDVSIYKSNPYKGQYIDETTSAVAQYIADNYENASGLVATVLGCKDKPQIVIPESEY